MNTMQATFSNWLWALSSPDRGRKIDDNTYLIHNSQTDPTRFSICFMFTRLAVTSDASVFNLVMNRGGYFHGGLIHRQVHDHQPPAEGAAKMNERRWEISLGSLRVFDTAVLICSMGYAYLLIVRKCLQCSHWSISCVARIFHKGGFYSIEWRACYESMFRPTRCISSYFVASRGDWATAPAALLPFWRHPCEVRLIL